MTVKWKAPASTGGSAITGYVVTAYVGSTAKKAVTVGDVLTATVTGLTNGTSYVFRVHAVNSMGAGPNSAASAAVVPATVPGPPTAVSGARGNARVTVKWKAPASTGGSAITGYVVTAYVGSTAKKAVTVGNVSTATVTGLTNGTSYVFRVHAVNSMGAGPNSAASAAAVPATVPGPPTAVSGARGNARVTVKWKAPASTGGSAITGYVVTAYVGSTAKKAVTVGNVLTATVIGLTNGTSYTFTVAARNALGSGPASTHSAAVQPL